MTYESSKAYDRMDRLMKRLIGAFIALLAAGIYAFAIWVAIKSYWPIGVVISMIGIIFGFGAWKMFKLAGETKEGRR